ncbi:MAG: GNAT family N-acetyltransferase [Dehalococcoidia bacterium]
MAGKWPARLVVRPVRETEARVIARWRYSGPWRVYDLGPNATTVNAANGYEAVADHSSDELVGFCCSGEEARVPGLRGEPDLVDVGLGMAPEWVGAGHGAEFGRVVVGHYRAMHPGVALRAAVQSWNKRSLRVTVRLGFVDRGHHECAQGGQDVRYSVMVLPG